jgi:hypothetical protein
MKSSKSPEKPKKKSSSKRRKVDIDSMWDISEEVTSQDEEDRPDLIGLSPALPASAPKNSEQKTTAHTATGAHTVTPGVAVTPAVTATPAHTDTPAVTVTPKVAVTPARTVRRSKRKKHKPKIDLNGYLKSLAIYRQKIPNERATVMRTLLRHLRIFLKSPSERITPRVFLSSLYEHISVEGRGSKRVTGDFSSSYRRAWARLEDEGYVTEVHRRLRGPMSKQGTIYKINYRFWINPEMNLQKASIRKLLIERLLTQEAIKDGDMDAINHLLNVQDELKRRGIDDTQLRMFDQQSSQEG